MVRRPFCLRGGKAPIKSQACSRAKLIKRWGLNQDFSFADGRGGRQSSKPCRWRTKSQQHATNNDGQPVCPGSMELAAESDEAWRVSVHFCQDAKITGPRYGPPSPTAQAKTALCGMVVCSCQRLLHLFYTILHKLVQKARHQRSSDCHAQPHRSCRSYFYTHHSDAQAEPRVL